MSVNCLTDKGNRKLYLYDDINNESILNITSSLISLLKEDNDKDEKEKDYTRQPISLYINSYGGHVNDMWGLIDIISNSETEIHTYCMGYAMSAAFLIFLAGHKRYCYKHSTFMYHQCKCGNYDKYQNVVEYREEEEDYVNKTIEEYVLDKTKFTKEEIDNIRERKIDYYIHSDKALEYEIIDEIL